MTLKCSDRHQPGAFQEWPRETWADSQFLLGADASLDLASFPSTHCFELCLCKFQLEADPVVNKKVKSLLWGQSHDWGVIQCFGSLSWWFHRTRDGLDLPSAFASVPYLVN